MVGKAAASTPPNMQFLPFSGKVAQTSLQMVMQPWACLRLKAQRGGIDDASEKESR